MSRIPIRLVTRHYDTVTPLLTGDVEAEGIDLQLDCDTPMARFLDDPSFQAGELSISGYARRLAAGDREIVGLPIFICRGFRHRNFFVRSDSGLDSFSSLAGKRIGTNGWPDTGNVWSRSLLRDDGVDLDGIEWWVGPIDDTIHPLYGPPSSNMTCAPVSVREIPEGKTLVGMLLANELDALIVNRPPQAFLEGDQRISRAFPDFRKIEERYAATTGLYPSHHVVGVRSSLVEQAPWICTSLFNAFEESRVLAEDRRTLLADTAPWLQDDLETIRRILGPDWQAHGIEPNKGVTQKICVELYEQGILNSRVEPSHLFGDFSNTLSQTS